MEQSSKGELSGKARIMSHIFFQILILRSLGSMMEKYNHTTFQHFLPVKILLIFSAILTFHVILGQTILTLQQFDHRISHF